MFCTGLQDTRGQKRAETSDSAEELLSPSKPQKIAWKTWRKVPSPVALLVNPFLASREIIRMCESCLNSRCECDHGKSRSDLSADGETSLADDHVADGGRACHGPGESQRNPIPLRDGEITNNSLLEQQKCRTLRRVARLIRNKKGE